MQTIYSDKNDRDKDNEIEEYINKIESEGENLIFNFYELENKIYRYDLDKVNEINNII